jgi:hypothetical protein
MVTSTPRTQRNSKYDPVHVVTTTPGASIQPDQKRAGYWFARIDYVLSNGKNAPIAFHKVNKDLIKRGMRISTDGTLLKDGRNFTSELKYNEALKCEELVFNHLKPSGDQSMEESHQEPSADFEGYQDSDSITELSNLDQDPFPASSRKTVSRAEYSESQLDPDFKFLLDQCLNGHVYMTSRLGVREHIRPDTIQKYVTSVNIAFVDIYKAKKQIGELS